ncbi:Hsp20/alpha crystallin family protein [Desulfoluna spongiiphila]|nr:Hsp20/alpha crystallin family protein [Desulfoluna spongiiphila]
MRPRLSTMPRLAKAAPALGPDETLILKDQGGYRAHPGAGWKVVECLLTDKRLILWQLRKIVLEVPLSSISDLRTGTFYYVLRKRPALGVWFHPAGAQRPRVAWIIVNGARIWKARLFQMSLLKVDEALVASLAEKLDDSCRAILMHLWERGHARIVELAEVCGTDNHMDVLMHVKDAINPMAVKTMGCPILSFERKRVDPGTGETVLFSWWLAGSPQRGTAQRERLLDLFDEGGHYQVILDVKGVERRDLHVGVAGRELTVESRHASSRWVERFELPEKVVFDAHRVSLKNTLLEICLRKAGDGS